MDALLGGAIQGDTPGAAVLVSEEGKVLLEKGYGFANVETRVAVTPDTRFRIGSITKQFTAAAILKLQEQGKLRIEDTLSKFIPDWPRGGEVTLYHLLTHSSGIHNYTAKPDFQAHVTQGVSLAALIQSFKSDAYDFDPGKKFSYDNSGYVLLGFIVEKASGLAYGEYLHRTFFVPLGMKSTGVYESGEPLAQEALGYSYEGGKVCRAVDWNMSKVASAGAIYSTVRDLYRWNEALFNGKVLSPGSMKAAFTVGRIDGDDPSHPEDTGYGYGWTIDRLRGEREISHGGELAGFGSYLLRLPARKITVVVLLNCVPQLPGLQQWALARKISEWVLGPAAQPIPASNSKVTVSSATLEALAGRYDMGSKLILTVTHDGERAFIEITGRPKTEIFPRSDRNFFVNQGEAEATFVKNPSGRVVKVILKQAGERIDATKLD